MHDVAALAGVSIKTVSRVVNGEKGVSPNVVERVQRATEKLQYRHNLAASNLRSGQRTKSVALLVQDLSNDYSALLLRAVDDVMREHGVIVFSASLDEEAEREQQLVTKFIERRVDGLLLMPATPSQAYLQSEMAAGFAVVVVDRVPRDLSADYVVVDNVDGARKATAHLIAHGHRRIAMICDDLSIPTARERRDGYLDMLCASGIAIDDSLILVARTEQAATATVLELFSSSDPPTALFTARNTITVGAVAALKALELQFSVALVGFDDIPMANLLNPGITTVVQDVNQIGTLVAKLLLARLDGSLDQHRGIILQTALSPRGSGEIRKE